MMDKLVERKIVTWAEDRPTSREFLDYSWARHLGGFWLEEYMFLQLSDLGLTDLAVGVSGTWQASQVRQLAHVSP
jgi:hypothetical protein